MVEEFEFAPEIGAGDFAAEEALVLRDRADDLVGGFVDELDAEAAGAEGEEAVEVFGAGLGAVVVDSVAAAGVGLEREFGAGAVLEADLVFFAGAAAVVVVFAGGEEGAEDAVLHVKHGHVLMDGEVEPRRGRGGEEGFELDDVEIVAGGDAFESVAGNKILGGERVGDVEGEVPAFAVVGEEGEVVVVADEVAVSLARADLFQDPFFAGFGDAGRGDPDGRVKSEV